MKIVLTKKENASIGFARFLIRAIKRQYIRQLNIGKLYNVNKYMNEVLCRKSKRKIRAYDTIIRGFNNLRYVKTGDTIIIEINPLVKVPYYDKIPLVDVCRLINYGNTEVNPYPVFSGVFNDIKRNLERLYKIYNSPLGGTL